MPYDLSPEYADAIKGFEGYTPRAQWDYKQNSNGYGTKAQYPGEVIDRDTAEQRFQAEVGKAAGYVDQIAPNAPPGVRAALTSLTYNAGPGWMGAGLGDLVRAGDWAGAAERFQQYNKAGGQVNQGLVNRRTKEAAWFGAPLAPQEAAPIQTAQAAPLAAPARPAVTQASPSVPGSFQGLPAYGFTPQTQPTGISGGQPSPQMADFGQPPPQMAGLPPAMGAPRRPPDLTKLRALLAQGPQSKAFSFSRSS